MRAELPTSPILGIFATKRRKNYWSFDSKPPRAYGRNDNSAAAPVSLCYCDDESLILARISMNHRTRQWNTEDAEEGGGR